MHVVGAGLAACFEESFGDGPPRLPMSCSGMHEIMRSAAVTARFVVDPAGRQPGRRVRHAWITKMILVVKPRRRTSSGIADRPLRRGDSGGALGYTMVGRTAGLAPIARIAPIACGNQ